MENSMVDDKKYQFLFNIPKMYKIQLESNTL